MWKDFVQSNRLLKRLKESQGFIDLTDLTSRETTLKILNFIGLFVKKKKSEIVDRVVTLC